MPDGELMNPVLPALFDVVLSLLPLLIAAPLLALFVGALVSIQRRRTAMSGLEELGWCAFVVLAQVIGPLIWFLLGRERYDWAYSAPAARQKERIS